MKFRLVTTLCVVEIGSAVSFFSVKNYTDEFLVALDKDFKEIVSTDTADDETVASTADEIIENQI